MLTPGGLGYEVHLAPKALSALPQKGGAVAFHVHLVVREDAQELFGFESLEEREVFRTLISISGFGPRKAQSVVNQYSPEELTRIRITSYNVCYTKLLRVGQLEDVVLPFAQGGDADQEGVQAVVVV